MNAETKNERSQTTTGQPRRCEDLDRAAHQDHHGDRNEHVQPLTNVNFNISVGTAFRAR